MQISASMLQDGIAPEMNQYYWDALEKEIEKMNVLIDEMLNLAKYESGTYQIQMEQVNIVDLIQKAEQDLQVQIDEKSLQIKLNIDDVCQGENEFIGTGYNKLVYKCDSLYRCKQIIVIDVKRNNMTYI